MNQSEIMEDKWE